MSLKAMERPSIDVVKSHGKSSIETVNIWRNTMRDFLRKISPMMSPEGEPGGTGGADPDNNSAGGSGDTGNGKDSKPDLKYSDADMNAILNKAYAKWQKKADEKIAEAEKLATMDAQKKAEYERDQLQKQLDDLKAANTRAELANEARKILSEDNISIGENLLNTLVGKDADSTSKNIADFKAAFNKAVDQGVKDALKGKSPTQGSGSTMTKAEIMKVKDTKERQKLIRDHIELFKK